MVTWKCVSASDSSVYNPYGDVSAIDYKQGGDIDEARL